MKNHILNRSEGKNSTTGWAQPVGLIAFDADDTLWDNQGHFEAVEKAYCRLLSPYGTAEQVSAALFETETANMPLLGYGCKAFTLSLVFSPNIPSAAPQLNPIRFRHFCIALISAPRICG